MKKFYVLDTSVIIHDPKIYSQFKNSEMIIPIGVLNELDKLKTGMNEAGKNARVAIRYLDEILVGDVKAGIKLANNVVVKIHMPKLDESIDNSYVDNQILQSLAELSKGKKNKPILLSRDINLRVRAKAEGLLAEGYEKNSKSKDDEVYSGFITIISEELGDELNEKEVLNIGMYDELKGLLPNEGVYFTDATGDGIALGRRVGDKVVKIKSKKPWGLDTRNIHQAFAVDYIMDHKIPMTILDGPAGGGKSLISIACGLELVMNQKKFDKLIITRPVTVIEDLGFLPGSLEEKQSYFFQNIYDSFQILLGKDAKDDSWKRMVELWLRKGTLEFATFTHLRGRSLSGCFIICDEVQNLSSDNMKLMLTRLSDKTKIVINGDAEQIDNKSLDIYQNGLTAVVNAFHGHKLNSRVRFTESQRSEVAKAATELL